MSKAESSTIFSDAGAGKKEEINDGKEKIVKKENLPYFLLNF